MCVSFAITHWIICASLCFGFCVYIDLGVLRGQLVQNPSPVFRSLLLINHKIYFHVYHENVIFKMFI